MPATYIILNQEIISDISRMDMSTVRSWSWIIEYWSVIYCVLFITGMIFAVLSSSAYYVTTQMIVILVTMTPLTYIRLVRGGCTIRFRICALVKGLIVGITLLVLSITTDLILWAVFGPAIQWFYIRDTQTANRIYQMWFLSGVVGGLAARIAEVRYEHRDSQLVDIDVQPT